MESDIFKAYTYLIADFCARGYYIERKLVPRDVAKNLRLVEKVYSTEK